MTSNREHLSASFAESPRSRSGCRNDRMTSARAHERSLSSVLRCHQLFVVAMAVIMAMAVVGVSDRFDHLLDLFLVPYVLEALAPPEQLSAQLARIHVIVMVLEAPRDHLLDLFLVPYVLEALAPPEQLSAQLARIHVIVMVLEAQEGLAVVLGAVENPQPHHTAHAARGRRVPEAGQLRLDAAIRALAVPGWAVPR
eukprot:CAMPEP_0179911084 /NCGR_PEP_ID=MMETSP0982-20121206/46140_1 /TAXON_ID=483367 /ORGANISM="non described non described, Strain CCMP 2436" /LENGTH=196 /DNA_ID=CAMNT_0021812737 /DNA_START=263 /DNA_END=849 /DNA_ORIENTATION=+